MDEHGTTVQCEKCKQWVSGSHNCEIWTTVIDGKSVAIGVLEHCGDNKCNHHHYYRPLTELEVEEMFKPANVNPIRDKYKTDKEIWQAIRNSQINYKGQPCKLIPA